MHAVLKVAALSFGLTAASTAAHATLIDFTDPSTFTTVGATITGSGFDTLSATGGNFNIAEAGPGAIGPLAGTIDGVGIGNDEISFPTQSVTLSFADEVTLTAIHLLDFFLGEEMTVSNGTDTLTFLAVAVDTIGYFTGGIGLAGSVFTFTPGEPDDKPYGGIGDFALAGVEFEDSVPIVPLPAGALLLGAALGGLAISRRRKPTTDA